MKKLFIVALICSAIATSGQSKVIETEIAVNSLISGTLFTPENAKKTELVILIAGSGPTDRNGNNPTMTNNSLKLLARGLAGEGTSVFSYDKRIIAMMKSGSLDEGSLRFEDFIGDAEDVIAHFRKEGKFGKIIVAGHSEGALIGSVAARNQKTDGYISIAGPARPIDQIITDQLLVQLPGLRDEIQSNFEKVKKGEPFTSSPVLASVFRESARPYLASWIKYNPQEEIAKLNVPVLIVSGTRDLQVKTTEADALKRAKPDAKLVIIENMNHIFKTITGDDATNFATYSNPDFPVNTELVSAVNQFIKTL